MSNIAYSTKRSGLQRLLQRDRKLLIGGMAFTLLIAAIGYGLAFLPGFHYVGQMACAILIAVAYRQLLGYPHLLQPGIQFVSKNLLRLAIVLYGLRLNVTAIYQDGLGLLARDAVAVLFAIGCTMLLARWLRADLKLSLLLGIGTGICGAAAIAAVSPILRAREEDTALGAGLIALVGTLFAVAYTLLRPIVGLTGLQYGIWSGTSLHEIAQVALAAAPAGKDALGMALLAKLGRVLLLVPVCLVIVVVQRRHSRITGRADEGRTRLPFPWFLVGFAAMSLLGSSAPGRHLLQSSPETMNILTTVTVFMLTMAMVGLGLNVNLRKLRVGALKSLAAMAVTSVLLAVWTYLSV